MEPFNYDEMYGPKAAGEGLFGAFSGTGADATKDSKNLKMRQAVASALMQGLVNKQQPQVGAPNFRNQATTMTIPPAGSQ